MKTIDGDIRGNLEPLRITENVMVTGDIRSGAAVLVDGNLRVLGTIEDAQIEATGDVTIGGGYAGIGLGNVICGGDFRANFVQGQRVQARGDIIVETGVLSGALFASKRVVVGNGEGRIVGGETQAYAGIKTGSIGGRRPITTRLQVGIDPTVNLGIECLERKAMELARRRIGFLKDSIYLERKPGESPRNAAADLKAAADAVQADIMEVGEEIIDLRKVARMNTEATIEVHRICHPPVEVSICFSRVFNELETGPVVFRLLQDRIVLDYWNLR